jgi:beta-glucosidase
VPVEVAIPRPTAAEIADVNAAMKKFVDSDKSSSKALLKKYESLLMLQPARLNIAATYTQTTQRMGPRHEGFVDIARRGNVDLLLHGDSITDWWVQGDANRAMFEKYFGGYRTANFAISGDTTQGVLWRLQNGESKGHKPKAVMLMLGTNNTGGASGAEIAEGLGAIVLQLRNDFPDAKILLLAIFPRGSGPNDSNRKKCEEANKIIARLHDGKHVFFTDINSKFLKPDGSLIGFRTTDNLHPVEEGYEIWASSVAPTLKSWIK